MNMKENWGKHNMINGGLDTYTVVDVETPNRKNDSICSIGLVHVENGQVVSKEHFLVNPDSNFDELNIGIHHITKSMILSEPNFKTIWEKISHYFTNGIIVAHNATFDLGVISKTLHNYEVVFPDFYYMCTYELSTKVFMDLDHHKLDNLCNYLDIKLENHHDALADAIACNELFVKIKTLYNIGRNDVQIYHLRDDYKQNVSQNLITKDLNNLYGLIQGIDADQNINTTEIAAVRYWVNDNKKYSKVSPFDVILEKINSITEDNILTSKEKSELLIKIERYSSKGAFSDTTLSFQILMGILEGVNCDKHLNLTELNTLRDWLGDNIQLKGNYPYDAIIKVIEDVLEDGIISEEENNKLVKLFEGFVNPTETKSDGTISLQNKLICLTGEFEFGSKADVEAVITKLGGEIAHGVTSKLNILVVGGEGSDNWSFGNYGTKVKKALELNSSGKNILIIGENAFLETIKC